MLEYGCTRLEIGVQSVYEDVARDTNRYKKYPVFIIESLMLLLSLPPFRYPFVNYSSLVIVRMTQVN